MTSKELWNPDETFLNKDYMDERIRALASHRGFQHTLEIIRKSGTSFDKLKIAEVGCGTGTFSLGLSLLGASATLIDFNEKVLEQTEKIFDLYGCCASFIQGDCLMVPNDNLLGKFDLVISGGLAEHFEGINRVRCLAYHKLLLKPAGMAYIGVPNRFSPFYQMIKGFRKMTGTWKIDIEIAFSSRDLKNIAKELNFKKYYVIGNDPISKDMIVYTLGLISAMIDILPNNIRRNFRTWKTDRQSSLQRKSQKIETRMDTLKELYELIENHHNKISKNVVTDHFSAGLILFAFN
jgi:SAM-dependent methyltransferase